MANVISLDELTQKLEAGTIIAVEALPPKHFRTGHLPGAVNLPLDQLDAQAERQLPDKEAQIAVYCAGPACNNSHIAERRLRALGYSRVHVFAGGKEEWTRAGLDLEVA